MDFKNLKKMAETAKKSSEQKLKAQNEEKSLIGNMELPIIPTIDHEDLYSELTGEFLREIGG